MGTSALPMYDGGATGSSGKLSKRQQCEIQRGQMETERATFFPTWMDCDKFILPRRGRFQSTDINKGDRRNQSIIDSTATKSSGILTAGMVSGVTSPARPWFEVGTPDPAISELTEVKEWLHEVQLRISATFIQSNLYNKLPTLYTDVGVFGTGAMAVLEDPISVIRCYDFPVGSYALANDERMQVSTFTRVFRLTVQQVVMRWGQIDPETGTPDFLDARPSNISVAVQNLWRTGARQAWVEIVHFLQPNLNYDSTKIDPKYKQFESIYYERGAPTYQSASESDQHCLLEHTGFDEFPILIARWETNDGDIYGTNSPGITCLGDIKQLQLGAKRIAQAVEKMINPSLTGPASLRSSKVSLLPGDVSYNDVQQGQLGLRPIHEVNFGAAMQPMNEMQQECRERIKDAFFVNLILMMAESDRREITAREIDERHEEKMLAIGPVLEQLNVDVLDPLIIRTFNIMQRRGMIPPPPDALQGQPLRITYVSIMAQAQKQIALGGIERFAGFVGQYTQMAGPDALDLIDSDELVTQYADANGVPPKILRDKDQVAAIRDARAKQQQAQQAAQNAPQIAGAMKDLANSPTGGDSALAKLLGTTHAKQTVNATARPPVSVLPS